MYAKNYQGATEALNQVQSNANCIKNIGIGPRRKSNIPDVTKFLRRTGLRLEDLDNLQIIHVTGTNGKGTTCAYTERILRNHGYTTGFFSSPHLLDYRERIRLNGKPISKEEFSNYFWKIHDLLDSQKEDAMDMPFYFRYFTIMAFHIFLDKKVDVVILEVGIGGENDCTNVVRKTSVVGITPLDMDHMSLLGDSLEAIAWNKSGIMKEGCAAFTTSQPLSVLKVFQARSIEKKCTLKVVENNIYLENNSNIPIHVRKINASLALALAEAFIYKDINNNFKQFDPILAIKSIEETYWPGRFEIKQLHHLTFYLDGAHTLESSCICRDWYLSHLKNTNKKRCLVFNLTGERDPHIFFTELRKCDFDTVIFVPNIGRDTDMTDIFIEEQLENCQEFKKIWLEMEKSPMKNIEVFSSFLDVMNYLKKIGQCDVLVTGSIHLIGVALSVLDPTLNDTLEI